MNNNTTSRYPVGLIRQHSLQHPHHHQHDIRRQRSTEDEKIQQIFLTNSIKFRNKVSDNSNKCKSNHQAAFLNRPIVRVAWSEQSIKPKIDEGVQIIARQIQNRNSNKPIITRDIKGKFEKYPLKEKTTIPYSKQELAERLKLAWKEREENKNIDIFLAHGNIQKRCDSRMSTETNLTARSTPKFQKKNIIFGENRIHNEKICRSNIRNDTKDKKKPREYKKLEQVNGLEYQTWVPLNSYKKTRSNIAEDQSIVDDNIHGSKENNEIFKKKIQVPISEKKPSTRNNCQDWNTSVIINNKNEVTGENIIKSPSLILVKESDYSQAKIRRAKYQSGLNKAFVNPIIEKPATPKVPNRQNTFQKHFRRTSSAPPQNNTQIKYVRDILSISPCPIADESEKWTVNNQKSSVSKSLVTTNRSIKSAPTIKKRSKGNKKRSLSVSYFKYADNETVMANGEETNRRIKSGKNAFERKSTDVVTMVSLISSADSESEMDDISSKDDKLISELRNKLPTTSIIKSSNILSGSIRKPFKSVSFQQDSFDHEESPSQAEGARNEPKTHSRSRSFALNKGSRESSTTDINITPSFGLVIPRDAGVSPTSGTWRTGASEMLLVHSKANLASTSIEMILTDREKRCLAVPIGDIQDKKRKLLKCRSVIATPRINDTEKQLLVSKQSCYQTEMQSLQIKSQTSFNQQENDSLKLITIPQMSIIDIDVEANKKPITRTHCQTPKEKECWHLYRKMCDKGVFVSFDTVLRGMLTPTEYRLRQKEMSQNC